MAAITTAKNSHSVRKASEKISSSNIGSLIGALVTRIFVFHHAISSFKYFGSVIIASKVFLSTSRARDLAFSKSLTQIISYCKAGWRKINVPTRLANFLKLQLMILPNLLNKSRVRFTLSSGNSIDIFSESKIKPKYLQRWVGTVRLVSLLISTLNSCKNATVSLRLSTYFSKYFPTSKMSSKLIKYFYEVL